MTMTNTLEDLGNKIKKICDANMNLLCTIKSRSTNKVTCGFSYSLQCNLPLKGNSVNTGDDIGELFSLVPKKITKDVSSRLDDWQYNGEQLKEAEDIFNDNINYNVKTYADVILLNKKLLLVSRKIMKYFRDNMKAREILCDFISTAKCLQMAIKELFELTVDIEDTVSNNTELYDGINCITDGFIKIQTLLPNVQLKLSASYDSDKVIEQEHEECLPENKQHHETKTEHLANEINCLTERFEESNEIIRKEYTTTKEYFEAANQENEAKTEHLADEINKMTKKNKESVDSIHQVHKSSKESFDCRIKELVAAVIDLKARHHDQHLNYLKLRKNLWTNIVNKNSRVLSSNTTVGGHSGGVQSLAAFNGQGSIWLASGSCDKTIKIWDLEEQKLLGTLQGHSDWVTSIAIFYMQGFVWLASGSDDKTIKIWNAEKQTLMGTLQGHTHCVTSIATFDCHGCQCLASGSEDKTIKVWNAENRTLLGTLRGHSGEIWALTAFDYQGFKWLASGSEDNLIKMWDVEEKVLLGTLQGHSNCVVSLSTFDIQGTTYLASGSCDKTIKIWDVEMQTLVGTLQGHSGSVWSLIAFKHQGSTWLASGSSDKTIKIWGIQEQTLLGTLRGHSREAWSLAAFHFQGSTWLASGSQDKTIRLWGD